MQNGKVVGDERITCNKESNQTQTPQEWVTRGNGSDELEMYGPLVGNTRDMVPNPINTNSSGDFQINLSKFCIEKLCEILYYI